MKYTNIIFSLTITATFISCQKDIGKKNVETISIPKTDWAAVQTYYLEHIINSVAYLDSLKQVGHKSEKSKYYFKKTREHFKIAEPYASYLNPEVGHRANGPALPFYKEDNDKVLRPVGLQKIEESIYEDGTSLTDFNSEVYVTNGLLTNLKRNIEKRQLNAQRFFISTHQQLFRIVSLAIAGFDTPVSHLGIDETITSLKSLATVYKKSIQYLVIDKRNQLDKDFLDNVNKAVVFIEKNKDFDTFDRYTFTRDYLNPIMRNWVDIRKTCELWEPIKNKPFNFDAPTFFEENSFNLKYFTPYVNQNPTDAQIALGKKLFFDKKLSSNGAMACATCHIPEKAYADGLVTPKDNQGNELQRNTPTLINSAFQKSFFWDGRAPSILAQIASVFTNEKEFNSNVHEFSMEILEDSTYEVAFKDAYGKIARNNKDVIKAISSYISTLNGFSSKFDRNMRAEEDTFTSEEKLGYNLFMGKALCATCHFIPLTSGTVPPFFAEHEKEVIGIPETAANQQLDDDLGFYWRFNEPLHYGMFKTPTIRNVEVTAPYMHNGVYDSLEQVMEFYNLGGGGGMGFENLDHQTLPFDNLNLSNEEQKAIIAYMKTLTDDQVDDDDDAESAIY